SITGTVFKHFGAAQIMVQTQFPGKPHTAVNLNAVIVGKSGGFPTERFSHRDGFGANRGIFGNGPHGVVGSGTATIHIHGNFGACVLVCLKGANGYIKFVELAELIDHDVDHASSNADQLTAINGGADTEKALDCIIILPGEQFLCSQLDIVKANFVKII